MWIVGASMNKIYLKPIITGAVLLPIFALVLGLTTGFAAVIGGIGGLYGGALNPPAISANFFMDISYWYAPLTVLASLIVGAVMGALSAHYYHSGKIWARVVEIALGLVYLIGVWWFTFAIPLVALGLLLSLVYTELAVRVQFRPHTSLKALLHGTLIGPVLLVGSFSTSGAIYWTMPHHDAAAPIFLAALSLLCPGVGIILGSIFGAIEAYGHRHVPTKTAIIAAFSLLVVWGAYQAIGSFGFGLLPGLALTAWILAKAKHRVIKSLLVGGCSLGLLSTTVLSVNTTGLISHFNSGLIGISYGIAAGFFAGLIFAAIFTWAYRFNRHHLTWMISLALGLVIGLFGSWQGLIALLLAITFTMWAIKFSYESAENPILLDPV
ncbi:MAG: hypothetical protein K0S29_1055 [Gammaproteobacteria bacterium]|jgi:hypothetical protein|nr:hypothetical protein [Gammaproteobacteria bacterium]